MSKISDEELAAGIVIKIQDDIIIGGQTQVEAIKNYLHIIHKLYLANLRIEPSKTHIFPQTADLAGWYWKQGGFIEPSPHRRSSLLNTREEDIKKVKQMRSFIGLYKTLHMATPAMSRFITPLEDTVQGMQSNDPYNWTHSATQ